jgi:hypothetical protein
VKEKREIPLENRSDKYRISFKLSPLEKCVEKSDARE